MKIKLEENKEIQKLFHCWIKSSNLETIELVSNINILSDKINEIIDKLNTKEE